MTTWKWMVTASLLLSLSAVAQVKTPAASEAQQDPPQLQGVPASPAPQLTASVPNMPQQGQPAATTMDQTIQRVNAGLVQMGYPPNACSWNAGACRS